MAGRILNSRLEIQPLPSEARAADDLFKTLTHLTRTIDEHPSIHHLFNELDLHVAHRSISNYQRIKQFETERH